MGGGQQALLLWCTLLEGHLARVAGMQLHIWTACLGVNNLQYNRSGWSRPEHELSVTIGVVGEHALAYHHSRCRLQRLIESSQANPCCIKLPWHVIAVHANQQSSQ